MVNLGLSGKVAIVTGAGFGLGRMYAHTLADEGVAVAVADLDEVSAKAVAAEIAAKGVQSTAVQVDVSDEEAVGHMVSAVIGQLGGIDILVNNAGWRPRPHGSGYNEISDVFQDAAQWRRVFDVNVIGVLQCARACRSAMAARGGGVVINQTSMAAYNKPAGAYGVSKVACSGLTISLAAELAPDNIRVNGIAPGVMTQRMSDEAVAEVLNAQLIKRKGTPEDLAGALLYLCSGMSSFVTGVNLLVDGGVVRDI